MTRLLIFQYNHHQVSNCREKKGARENVECCSPEEIRTYAQTNACVFIYILRNGVTVSQHRASQPPQAKRGSGLALQGHSHCLHGLWEYFLSVSFYNPAGSKAGLLAGWLQSRDHQLLWLGSVQTQVSSTINGSFPRGHSDHNFCPSHYPDGPS